MAVLGLLAAAAITPNRRSRTLSAAIAESAGLVVLHEDKRFELIGSHRPPTERLNGTRISLVGRGLRVDRRAAAPDHRRRRRDRRDAVRRRGARARDLGSERDRTFLLEPGSRS